MKQLSSEFPDMTIELQRYGMHSFRRGGATDAREHGVDFTLLKAHGRWWSNAVEVYLNAGVEMQLSVTSGTDPSDVAIT